MTLFCAWPGIDTPARVIMLNACSYCFYAGRLKHGLAQ